MPAAEALTAIARVDMVITVATTAALRGYHRSDMPASPEWASELLRASGSGPRYLGAELGGVGGAEPERRGPLEEAPQTRQPQPEARDPSVPDAAPG